MRVILGSDLDGIKLKSRNETILIAKEKVEVIDKSESASEDFYRSNACCCSREVLKDTESLKESFLMVMGR